MISRVGLLVNHGTRMELAEGDEVALEDQRPMDDSGLPIMGDGKTFALYVESGYRVILTIRRKED